MVGDRPLWGVVLHFLVAGAEFRILWSMNLVRPVCSWCVWLEPGGSQMCMLGPWYQSQVRGLDSVASPCSR